MAEEALPREQKASYRDFEDRFEELFAFKAEQCDHCRSIALFRQRLVWFKDTLELVEIVRKVMGMPKVELTPPE